MADAPATERLLRRDRAIVMAAIAAMVVLAGVYTLLGVGMGMSAWEMTTMLGAWPASPGAGMASEMSGAMSGSSMAAGGMGGMVMAPAVWTPGYAVLVFLMWWVMMVAMMTSSAAPTVLLYAKLNAAGAGSATPRLALVFLSGYLAAWALFGVAATALQWGLEMRRLVSPDMMAATSQGVVGVVLLGAGLYQLSPLKTACLHHCRSPMRFLVERRRLGLAGAFLMGAEHGTWCVGCCWALMALLFVGGVMNLYWIAGLAVLVATEKLLRHGDRISQIVGAVLAAAGLWLVGGILV
jgi:predicted metal-binding membrane protein